jgi:hypothetical protein
MGFRQHDGQTTWIDDPNSAVVEKEEKKSDLERQTSHQPAKTEGRGCDGERLASDDAGPTNRMDWDGPEDPDNPHNWPTWKLVYHTTIPALFGFTM